MSQCSRVLAVLEDGIAGTRFFAKVDEQRNGCWLWTAARDQNGYGRFTVATRSGGGGRQRKAHRVLYEWLHGPVPTGLELDHTCRNPSCVNPEHLEPVTHAENIRRGYAANPRPLSERCSNGHAYTPENTLARSDGARSCRTCRRATQAAYRRRKRLLVPLCDARAAERLGPDGLSGEPSETGDSLSREEGTGAVGAPCFTSAPSSSESEGGGHVNRSRSESPLKHPPSLSPDESDEQLKMVIAA